MVDTSFFRKLNTSLEKLSRKVVEIDVDKIFDLARQQVKLKISGLLVKNLEDAIAKTPEFQYPELKSRLLEIFSNEAMVGFKGDGIVIYALSLAGDRYDWERVLASAKAEYSTGILSPTKALEFWTERVYKPAREGGTPKSYIRRNKFDYSAYGERAYRLAIATRLRHTGGAPFWIWLEYGVDASHYPSYGGTSFVAKTVAEGNQLYRDELLKQSEDIMNSVSAEIVQFFRNPEAYTPGQEIDKIEGFKLAVTPTRQELGITSLRTGVSTR